MVKGPKLKSKETPRLNLPEYLHVQSLTRGPKFADWRSARARAHVSLTRGAVMSVGQINQKCLARVCAGRDRTRVRVCAETGSLPLGYGQFAV